MTSRMTSPNRCGSVAPSAKNCSAEAWIPTRCNCPSHTPSLGAINPWRSETDTASGDVAGIVGQVILPQYRKVVLRDREPDCARSGELSLDKVGPEARRLVVDLGDQVFVHGVTIVARLSVWLTSGAWRRSHDRCCCPQAAREEARSNAMSTSSCDRGSTDGQAESRAVAALRSDSRSQVS